MTRTVLGLMGKAGSGKDTFAERLVTRHGYTRIAFADAVKGLATCIDPIIEIKYLPDEPGDFVRLSRILATFGGWDGAKAITGVRTLLQNLGVGVRDYVGQDAWLKAAIHKIGYVPGPVVITDVRFNNEADWIEANGALVRIERPSLDNHDRHVSENELNDRRASHVVVNNGLVADLHVTADLIAEHMVRRSGVLVAPHVPIVQL